VKVLHLHGNNIARVEEINKLVTMPQLRSLTLHGNPVETEKQYRLVCIFRTFSTMLFRTVIKRLYPIFMVVDVNDVFLVSLTKRPVIYKFWMIKSIAIESSFPSNEII